MRADCGTVRADFGSRRLSVNSWIATGPRSRDGRRCSGVSCWASLVVTTMKTTIAAIYARKSTDQNVAEDAKSVTRQVDNAKAFAHEKGWSVDDRFIFIDD